MYNIVRAALALSLAILFCAPASASPKVPHETHPRRALAPDLGMYSLHARRRARTILQLELMELRKARLERVRQAIERRVPVNQLLKLP